MAPNVDPFDFYLSAFGELSTCRSIGMGTGPIPFTAIVEYAKIYEVDDFYEFLFVIRKMDESFLNNQKSTSDKGKKDDPGKTGKKHNSKG